VPYVQIVLRLQRSTAAPNFLLLLPQESSFGVTQCTHTQRQQNPYPSGRVSFVSDSSSDILLRSTHSPATTIRTSSPREMNDRPRPRHGAKGVYMQEKGMYVNLRQKEAKRGKRRERREKREIRRLRLPTGSMTRDGRLHDAPSSRVPSPYLPSRAI
jgi:hypothetical protein